MYQRLTAAKNVAQAAWREWNRDNATLLAAAVAFHATFSLAPLLVLLLNATALLLGEAAARARLVEFVSYTAGGRAATAIERVVVSATTDDRGATILSIVVLLISASTVFRHLKLALNAVLDVPTPDEGGILLLLKKRAFAAVVAVAGILLLIAALAATAAIEWMSEYAPRALQSPGLWNVTEVLLSFTVIGLVFAAILKFVPDIDLQWRHVAAGSAMAALAYTIGQQLIAFWVARSSVAGAYGAAGSIILLLIYFYFTSAMLLAAAELTEVLARRDSEFRRARKQAQDKHAYEGRKDEDAGDDADDAAAPPNPVRSTS